MWIVGDCSLSLMWIIIVLWDNLFTSITNPKLKSNGSDCSLQFVFKCLFQWQLGPVPVQRPDHLPASAAQPRASSLAATVSDISCSKE